MHSLIDFTTHPWPTFFQGWRREVRPIPCVAYSRKLLSHALVLPKCHYLLSLQARGTAMQPISLQTRPIFSDLCNLALSQRNRPELLTMFMRRLNEPNVSLCLSRDRISTFSSKQSAFSWPWSLLMPSEDGPFPAPPQSLLSSPPSWYFHGACLPSWQGEHGG